MAGWSRYKGGYGMKVGFSGTRKGMTYDQKRVVTRLLRDKYSLLAPPFEFHHGLCVGADEQAAAIAKSIGYILVAHPGKDVKWRSKIMSHVTWDDKDYLERNHDIVDLAQHVICTPAQKHEVKRGSGTWHVIRIADDKFKPLTIVYPDGRIAHGRP